MKPRRTKERSVEILVTKEQMNFWTCAAALDPVPPTWAGPSWHTLLSTPLNAKRSTMTVLFPTSVLADFRSREDKETMHFVLPMIITDHALHILEQHGLQRIPANYTGQSKREPDDDIPF